VPVPTLERDESGPADACDWLAARGAPFGKEFSEALGAVGFVLARCEPLTGQGLLAMSAREALAMPRIVAISDSALGDDFVTLDALSGKLVFVALCAINVVLLGNKRLGPDWLLAGAADKALFVPLTRLVFHLLHTGSEDIRASVTSGCKLSVVASSAVDPLGFGSELLVHQRGPALCANETVLMPMLLLVRQIL